MYQLINSSSEMKTVELPNGVRQKSVVILRDGGDEYQIIKDEHCYVLVHDGYTVTHWFPEAVSALVNLPALK